MKINFKLILFLTFLLPPALFGQKKQGKALVDSLSEELPKAKEDTNKVNMLNEISFDLAFYKPKDGITYAVKGLEVATRLGWKKGIADMNNNLGIIYQTISDNTKSLEYFNKALTIFNEMAYNTGAASIMGNMGIIYSDQGNYPKALEYYFKALKFGEELGNKNLIASVCVNIGTVYTNQTNYSKALEYYFKALRIVEEMGDKSSLASNIGNIGNIGNIYYYQKNYSKALDYDFKALRISEDISNKYGIANFTGNIGSIYSQQRNYPEALEYYSKALKINEDIGNKDGIVVNIEDIGITYCKLREHARAIEYELKALKMATELNSLKDMKDCYEYLTEIYDSTRDYKKALEFSTKYHTTKDSIFSKDNGQKIVRLEMQNQYDRQHLADSLKAAEKEQLASIQLHRQRNYTYLGIAGIMLLLGFSFFIARERGKSEKERKKSDELLLNILPSEIAQELKVTGGSKAQQFDNVTVLFTDFVNFTRAGERMTPQALVDELDTCFKAFDNITGKYNIEKIKTIGDAYLAVCGLPKADPAHAENAVKAAQEVKDFMANRYTQLGDKTFEIRIGVHSGNVVAGIVGVKKFAYDIWGDTVNTAARMEQNSEPGKINISETTYALVKDKFTCTYRGEIEAKNKGMLKMYFVS